VAEFSGSGLVLGGRIGPQVLGHQGARWVVDRSDVASKLDEASGLCVYPLDQVFIRPEAPIIVFGTPNVSLVMPSADRSGWERFAAFMFWRQKSYVASTKGRVQAGVFFELTELPEKAVEALHEAINGLVGTRKASCAHSVALALHRAGFTSSVCSLKRVYRPSRLASVLWRGGLEYKGVPVKIRIIQTRQSISDHFVSVWKRELKSGVRLLQKCFKRSHGSAPLFDPADESIEMSHDLLEGCGPKVDLGISVPSSVGVNLGYIFGEQPEFVVKLPSTVAGDPLVPFSGKLNFWSKLKQRVLFSRPVVRVLRRHLVSRVDWMSGASIDTLPAVMRRSPGPERSQAFAYNFVVTRHELRLKRLTNDNGRDRKFVNWLLAKHVLIAGYDPAVMLSGELWCYLDQAGKLVVCLSGNSGTYKPSQERVEAIVKPLSEMFDARVEMVAV
jgi:hypothetical protein